MLGRWGRNVNGSLAILGVWATAVLVSARIPDSDRRSLLAPRESLIPLVAVAVLAAAVVWDVLFDVVGGPVTCPLRRATGVPCPACGLTRSFVALGNLDLRGAFVAHPLGPILAVALVAAAAEWGARLAGVRPLPARAWAAAWWALAAGFLVYGVLRAVLRLPV